MDGDRTRRDRTGRDRTEPNGAGQGGVRRGVKEGRDEYGQWKVWESGLKVSPRGLGSPLPDRPGRGGERASGGHHALTGKRRPPVVSGPAGSSPSIQPFVVPKVGFSVMRGGFSFSELLILWHTDHHNSTTLI